MGFTNGRSQGMLSRTLIARKKTGAPADCTEPLAVSGDLFGSAPKPARKAKTAKPIKRVFNITLTEPGPFAFAGIWDAWKRRMNIP